MVKVNVSKGFCNVLYDHEGNVSEGFETFSGLCGLGDLQVWSYFASLITIFLLKLSMMGLAYVLLIEAQEQDFTTQNVEFQVAGFKNYILRLNFTISVLKFVSTFLMNVRL